METSGWRPYALIWNRDIHKDDNHKENEHEKTTITKTTKTKMNMTQTTTTKNNIYCSCNIGKWYLYIRLSYLFIIPALISAALNKATLGIERSKAVCQNRANTSTAEQSKPSSKVWKESEQVWTFTDVTLANKDYKKKAAHIHLCAKSSDQQHKQ